MPTSAIADVHVRSRSGPLWSSIGLLSDPTAATRIVISVALCRTRFPATDPQIRASNRNTREHLSTLVLSAHSASVFRRRHYSFDGCGLAKNGASSHAVWTSGG